MKPEDFEDAREGSDENIEAQHQADTAISFLTYAACVEQGGDEGSGKRELTKTEEETRDSALSCVLLYLEKAFLQLRAPANATNRKPAAAVPKKKKSKLKK